MSRYGRSRVTSSRLQSWNESLGIRGLKSTRNGLTRNGRLQTVFGWPYSLKVKFSARIGSASRCQGRHDGKQFAWIDWLRDVYVVSRLQYTNAVLRACER